MDIIIYIILILRNRISYKYLSKDNTNLEQINITMDFKLITTTDIYYRVYKSSSDNKSINPN
jgi:hypothetical protein